MCGPEVIYFNYVFSVMYYNYAGGVVALNYENAVRVNGYSNDYWGWGNEDDDFSARYDIYMNTHVISNQYYL